MKFTKIIFLLILLSPFYDSSQSIANVYKQVDESGHVFYTDCPAGGNYKLVIKTDNLEETIRFAKSGNANAQYALGCSFINNYEQAFIWMKKAAEQSQKNAQYELGEMYFNGEGVAQDHKQAFFWYRKSSEQGNANAQFKLGIMYQYGNGVAKDNVLAYAWFILATMQDPEDTKVKLFLNEIKKEMTDAERAQGQRLASNWQKGDNLLYSTNVSAEETTLNVEPKIQSTGTAFVISGNGHLLTNYHLIKDCAEIKIAGHADIVKVISSDSVNDLALLQLPGNNHDTAKLNPDTNKLRQGEEVFVFGYPLNSVLSSGGNFTPGIISALAGLGNNINQLQITAPVQPGSSGSPVMDKRGNLIGVVSAKLDDSRLAKATGQVGQNINFAINGQTVKRFLDINKVSYKIGGGLFSFEKSNPDIAEEARKWTMLVECWNY